MELDIFVKIIVRFSLLTDTSMVILIKRLEVKKIHNNLAAMNNGLVPFVKVV